MIRLGLIGHGVIGKAVAAAVAEESAIELARVLVRRARSGAWFTTAIEAFLAARPTSSWSAPVTRRSATTACAVCTRAPISS